MNYHMTWNFADFNVCGFGGFSSILGPAENKRCLYSFEISLEFSLM